MAMARAAALMCLPAVQGNAVAQFTLGTPEAQITIGARPGDGQAPASPGWPFGRAHTRVRLEGLLVRSDGQTLSIELGEWRVIRFQMESATHYYPDAREGALASFHMTDYVQVDSEVNGRGTLTAHAVRFVRKASPGKKRRSFRARS